MPISPGVFPGQSSTTSGSAACVGMATNTPASNETVQAIRYMVEVPLKDCRWYSDSADKSPGHQQVKQRQIPLIPTRPRWPNSTADKARTLRCSRLRPAWLAPGLAQGRIRPVSAVLVLSEVSRRAGSLSFVMWRRHFKRPDNSPAGAKRLANGRRRDEIDHR